ncbi:capsular biosynthesis protein [Campylobacter helveticus]|uniref:Capsular biosynthesis protein n=1 Tax=Campylobacter helveticus TaxID=28898 RepID=A0ABY3L1A7_9BACT|nr:capsular biosynthesis protein [Campylobacter helveticus]TXK56847.1 capsular biosynthesis protein [Campylobacter helveticus]
MLLITSAKYSSSDFTLEFGKIVPSFLPLGNKRLYEYQANLSKNAEVVLSLPKSFKPSHYDLEKLEKLNIKLIFVDENLSLGESIFYCINALNINNKLSILHGDTFFKKLNLKEDSLCIGDVRENYEWAYLDEEFNFANDVGGGGGGILTGAFCFSGAKILAKHLLKNRYDFVKSIKSYSKEKKMWAIQNTTWLDFGLITNYFHSKKVISTQRSFNQIQIAKNYIIKNSSWSEKIKAEKEWFENLPPELLIYTPRYFSQKKGYALEYLCQNTLSELFVFGNLPSFVWEKIFLSIKDFLKICHSYKSEEKLNFNYKEKTLSRLKEFSRQRKIKLDKPFIFNHNICPSLNELVEFTDEFLPYVKEFVLIHGDFCFSNIMYDFRSDLIKTYDPRGMDFNSKISIFGDANYDFAKLIHSVLGLYDFIIAGFYECKLKGYELNFKLELSDNIFKIQETFRGIFKVDKSLLALCLHLFLSMLPLHYDDEKRQNALLANTYRIYTLLKEEQ